MAVANTLAYYDMATIMANESYSTGPCLIEGASSIVKLTHTFPIFILAYI
jgi:hypothetical protein